VITEGSPAWQQRLAWNVLDSLLGPAFYRCPTTSVLRSFSTRELFADFDRVDAEWLDTLIKGAANPASRYAVFRFIWVWRQDYKEAIATITQPTLVVVGTQHRVLVGQAGRKHGAKMADYLKYLQRSRS